MLSFLSRSSARLRASDGWPLLRGAAVALTIQSAATALAYVLQVALARWLGVSAYGGYSIAFTTATLLSIAITFGVPSMLVRFVPTYEQAGDLGRMRGAISFARRLVLGLGFGFAVAASGVVLVLHHAHHLRSVELVLGAIWLAPLLALLDLQMSTARAFRRISIGYVPQALVVPGLLAAGALAAPALGLPHSAAFAVVLFAAAALVVVPIQFLLIQRGLPRALRAAGRVSERPVWLRSSAAFVFLVGFSLLLVQTDVLMLGRLAGSAAAGLYAAGAKVVALTTLASEATAAVAAPLFAAAHASGNRARFQRLVSQASHIAFWPAAAIALLLVTHPEPVLAVFGGGFVEAAKVVPILALAQAVTVGIGPNGYLLGAAGHQAAQLVVSGGSVALNAALMLVAIPAFGIVGAAVVSGVMLIASNVVMHRLVVRRMGLRPSIWAALSVTSRRRRPLDLEVAPAAAQASAA